MAIFSYTTKVDEVVISRDQTTARVRTYLPPLTAEREGSLGRIFGFVELDMPRTPQVDKLLSAVDRELVAIYGQGALRPGENQEEYFENALRRVERRIFSVATENRIKVEKENIHAIFGVVFGTNLNLAAHGELNAYLIRRPPGKPTRVVDILAGTDGETDPDGRLLSTVICGKIDLGDVILITNRTMAKVVPVADFVQNTSEAEEAALGSHLRSLALMNPPAQPAVGMIIRLAASRQTKTETENPSVKAMLTREEEVARVLEPSGIPKLQNVFGKMIANRDKKETPPARPARPKSSAGSWLDRVNGLNRRAKITLLVAVTLFGVFFLSAEIISMRNRAAAAAKQYAAAEKSIRDISDEAESSIIYDETRSGVLIGQARAALAALAALPDLTKQQQADHVTLLARLDDLSRRLKHIYQVKPTSLASLGAAPEVMALVDGTLYAAAGDNLLSVADGKGQSLATFPAAPAWGAADAGKIYFMLTNNTLLAFDPKSTVPTAVTYSGPANPRSGGFWNGRLYVAAGDGAQIFRLNATANGFAGSTAWLKAPPAGAGMTAIALDGSIFAAFPGTGVRDYVKGNPSSFAASGATANADPKALYIGNDLYLLGGDGTIAEWDNKGTLLAQYALPAGNGKPTAFTVDETTKNIYVGTDSGAVLVFSIAK